MLKVNSDLWNGGYENFINLVSGVVGRQVGGGTSCSCQRPLLVDEQGVRSGGF